MNNKNGFWVKFWMESGRGRSIINENYFYFKYKDGYSETDTFEEDAYNWAGQDMGGFELMRFKSGFEIVIVPPSYWLREELTKLKTNKNEIEEKENLIKKELGIE